MQLVLVLVVAGVTAPAMAQQAISGPDFVRLVEASLAGGGDVDEVGLAVAGDVDLRSLQSVDRPIRCSQCRFGGAFNARDVRFGGIVDLTGSTFVGSVDLRGATFDRIAIFDISRFLSPVDLRTARFGDLASFSNARFFDSARFDRTAFNGRALFSSNDPRTLRPVEEKCGSAQPAFIGSVTFIGTLFEDRADFRQRCFESKATFTGASFGSTVDFTRSSLFEKADFAQATFGEGAQFRITDFGGGATFEGAASEGEMNFGGSTLRARIDFDGLGGSGALLIDDIISPLSDDVLYEMNNVSIGSVIMSTAQVKRIGGPLVQQNVLELVAESARDDGQLSLANDAQFDLLALQRAEQTGLDRVWWWLGERVGGYLVRPINPIIALLLAVLGGAAVRVGWSWWKRRGSSVGVPVAHLIDDSFSALAASTEVAARGKPGIEKPAGEGGKPARKRDYLFALLRFSEWFVYRLLVVVALVGVARSIPVIRELIDAVF